MTLLEVAKHALEAMEDAMYRADTHEFYDAKESLRYAIEQAEQQEPVAWAVYDILHGGSKTLHWPEQHSPNGDSKQYKAVPLYTAPTPRKPVELTDGEILDANYADGEEADPIIAAPDSELIAFSRAVMAVQRDKEGKPMAHWHGLIEPQKDAAAFAPRKPLTDEEMRECAQAMNAEPLAEGWPELIKFARAIENKHGIGEQHE